MQHGTKYDIMRKNRKHNEDINRQCGQLYMITKVTFIYVDVICVSNVNIKR